MRCLGRLVSLVVLCLLLGVGWLYRDELQRKVQDLIHPMDAVRRVGEPSLSAAASARKKLASLRGTHADSVVLSAAEVGAMLLDGLGWSETLANDSLQVELGDRSIRVAGRVSTDFISKAVRDYIKLPLGARESVAFEGPFTPSAPGVAEWQLDKVSVHGMRLPASLVARVMNSAGVPGADHNLQLTLPPGVTGFRVRPDGAAFYGAAR